MIEYKFISTFFYLYDGVFPSHNTGLGRRRLGLRCRFWQSAPQLRNTNCAIQTHQLLQYQFRKRTLAGLGFTSTASTARRDSRLASPASPTRSHTVGVFNQQCEGDAVCLGSTDTQVFHNRTIGYDLFIESPLASHN